MRTVSFSNDQVNQAIAKNFIATYTNTEGDPSAGGSFSHAPDEPPGPCGRGAGRQNVQTFFLTPTGQIFHVASGYLSPADLLEEMDFALEVFPKLNQGDPQQASSYLVAAVSDRLKSEGFSASELRGDDSLRSLLATNLAPSDFGFELPGANLLADAPRQRRLLDAKFVLRNPLKPREQFVNNPAELVGHHKSFFGSHSMINGFQPNFGSR
ncbi:MAG: hypothetical protein MI861_16375 [Pirellulales bacterium]|nr:hypothetical protein [Pirellulales bacterium]